MRGARRALTIIDEQGNQETSEISSRTKTILFWSRTVKKTAVVGYEVTNGDVHKVKKETTSIIQSQATGTTVVALKKMFKRRKKSLLMNDNLGAGSTGGDSGSKGLDILSAFRGELTIGATTQDECNTILKNAALLVVSTSQGKYPSADR